MHARSDRVFAKVELPALLNDGVVSTINGIGKHDFAWDFWRTR
ncbi:MAG TPA: hypothetical protein VFY84_20155 [Jiangellales bacterium]|nr:hypothetical protein [Jiangellales bacterium]